MTVYLLSIAGIYKNIAAIDGGQTACFDSSFLHVEIVFYYAVTAIL